MWCHNLNVTELNFFSVCSVLQDECHNFIKVLLRQNNETLFVCGTNAFNPSCRTFKVTLGLLWCHHFTQVCQETWYANMSARFVTVESRAVIDCFRVSDSQVCAGIYKEHRSHAVVSTEATVRPRVGVAVRHVLLRGISRYRPDVFIPVISFRSDHM